MKLSKIANRFEILLATEVRRKKDDGKDFQVEDEIIEDLIKSMRGCLSTLEDNLPKIEEMSRSKSGNDLVSISGDTLGSIRNFSGHLALLCNMIINGKEYSKEDTREAVLDKTTEE